MTVSDIPASWPELPAELVYGRHRNATSGGIWHIWRAAPTPRSKQRHETLCGTVMTEAPHGPDARAPYTTLCAQCRKELPLTPSEEPMPKTANITDTGQAPELPELPAELAGWHWHTHRARGSTTGALEPHYALQEPVGDWMTAAYTKPERTIAEAKRRVLSTPATKPAAIGSVLTDVALDDAIQRLRGAGCHVERQGMHWRARIGYGEPMVQTGDELKALARDLPPAAPPSMIPGSSSAPLPLMDLISALEAHAAGLPTPLPTSHRIPLPIGLPERLPAPLDLLVPGRYQPRTRFDQDELDQLAASIQEHGILTALKVFANEAGRLELIAGERRLRAARQAGLAFVPVELCSYSLRQIDEISTIDNLQRKDLSPIEEGTAYERMIRDWGISEAELARRLGKNRGYIQQRRAIASAVPEVVTALDQGAITFSQARGIALGAPGHAAAQNEALKRLGQRMSWEGPATEEDAKKYADEAVLSSSKDALAALGWRIVRSSIGSGKPLTIVYTDRVRPVAVTSAEILAMLREQRRPPEDGDVLRAAEISQADRDVMGVRSWQVDSTSLKPWLLVLAGKTKFLPAGELAPIVAQARQDFEDLQARYAKAGWTLKANGKGRDDFNATTKEGRNEHLWSWATASGMAKKIEAGKISKTADTTLRACARCAKTKETTYHDGGYHCADCSRAIRAEQQREHAAIRASLQAEADAWLATAPDRVLRLLATLITQGGPLQIRRYADLSERALAIRQADTALLGTVALDVLESLAYAARQLDLGPTAEPVTAATTDADDPLMALNTRLTQVEVWITQAVATPPDLSAISGTEETLDDIDDDLAGLADDNATIDDEAFEGLLMRIGQARRQLTALAETAAAPQLAEVEA